MIVVGNSTFTVALAVLELSDAKTALIITMLGEGKAAGAV